MSILKLLKPILFLFLVFIGWIAMANVLTYKQFDCIYNSKDKYIWIKLNNNVDDKGLRFVSDGVIFDSSVFGFSRASDYDAITRVVFGEGEQDYGYLTVERKTREGDIAVEEIGLVDAQCWRNLKELVIANPLSQHITMVDAGETTRNAVN